MHFSLSAAHHPPSLALGKCEVLIYPIGYMIFQELQRFAHAPCFS